MTIVHMVSCVEGSVRDGKEEFATIDMEKYKQYTFGMYSGEVKEVTMVFTNNMVNAVVDRFWTEHYDSQGR